MTIYSGLLFLDGHVADVDLARQLARHAAPQPPSQTSPVVTSTQASARVPPQSSAPGCRMGVLARIVDMLGLLGGRPMHAGHNNDVGEPLPLPAACTRPAAMPSAPARRASRPGRPRPPRRRPACSYCA